jgi:hypothetical protein
LVEEITYASKSTLEVLLGNVVHQKSFDKHSITIYDSNILHFVMNDSQSMTSQDLENSREWTQSIGGGEYLNLIEAGSRTEIEDDMRRSSASDTENRHTIADAIVVRNLSQRIIANLYLRFNKPVKPTRIFSDAESAAFWLMSFR